MKQYKMLKRHKFILYLVLSAMLLTGLYLYAVQEIPDIMYTLSGENLNIKNTFYPITTTTKNENTDKSDDYTVDVKLLGMIPIKEVSVNIISQSMLVPGGESFGVKFYTDGAVVVGLNNVKIENGEVNPASDAGIKENDIIKKIDGKKIENNEQLSKIVRESGGKKLVLSVTRKEATVDIEVTPQQDIDSGEYKLGLWVRDSTAGIGTITFYEPKSKQFGALGHGICDIDTASLMPLRYADVYASEIYSVRKGASGYPGELKGIFLDSNPIGSLYKNTIEGVFGKLSSKYKINKKAVEIGLKDDVVEGEATILCTVDEEGVKEYKVEIIKINKGSQKTTKNMLIKVTDSALLEKTGGIVQGMSGSPILQNGKIIGAVTHVLVNEPDKGYGIFIENMLANLK